MEQKLNWELIESFPIANRSNFWKSILLSISKPHLINRRLAGAEQLSVYQSKFNDNSSLPSTFINQLTRCAQCTEDFNENILSEILQDTQTIDAFHEIDIQCASKCDLNEEKHVFVMLSKLLPKNLATNKITYEIAVVGNIMVLMVDYSMI